VKFEYNMCMSVLSFEPQWFQSDRIGEKLECLEKFRADGNPSSIALLESYLSHSNDRIRNTTASVIIELFEKLKSQNELYDSLRQIRIHRHRVATYQTLFNPDVVVKLFAITSFNHDGYVREAAVNALRVTGDSYAVKFILLRLGDWVKQVRDAAERALQFFLKEEFLGSFINELATIDRLQYVERVDLSKIRALIMNATFSKKLSIDIYSGIKNPKIRQLYLRTYFSSETFTSEYAEWMLNDSHFGVRIELLKLVNQLNSSERRGVIRRLLNDRATTVRLKTLYSIRNEILTFEPDMFPLISDPSPSIRDFVRYYLKYKEIDFAELYRDRVSRGELLSGSLSGLAETGSSEDIDIFTKHLIESESSIKAVCLLALKRFDLQLAVNYSLKFILSDSSIVRNAAMVVLQSGWERRIAFELRKSYSEAKLIQKISILKLFSAIGGWDSIGIIIEAISDADATVQNRAWDFMRSWYQRAFRLFTKPDNASLAEAIARYEATDLSRINADYSRLKVWKEIGFYLRR
jgi:HEAT repeat protein